MSTEQPINNEFRRKLYRLSCLAFCYALLGCEPAIERSTQEEIDLCQKVLSSEPFINSGIINHFQTQHEIRTAIQKDLHEGIPLSEIEEAKHLSMQEQDAMRQSGVVPNIPPSPEELKKTLKKIKTDTEVIVQIPSCEERDLQFVSPLTHRREGVSIEHIINKASPVYAAWYQLIPTQNTLYLRWYNEITNSQLANSWIGGQFKPDQNSILLTSPGTIPKRNNTFLHEYLHYLQTQYEREFFDDTHYILAYDAMKRFDPQYFDATQSNINEIKVLVDNAMRNNNLLAYKQSPIEIPVSLSLRHIGEEGIHLQYSHDQINYIQAYMAILTGEEDLLSYVMRDCLVAFLSGELIAPPDLTSMEESATNTGAKEVYDEILKLLNST